MGTSLNLGDEISLKTSFADIDERELLYTDLMNNAKRIMSLSCGMECREGVCPLYIDFGVAGVTTRKRCFKAYLYEVF